MSNVHRIMWFDQAIRQHRYPNCSSLAKHFEISLRQANRDIEYLKNTMNAPLRYVAVKRGFTYDDMTFILPNLVITAQERKALSFLAHRYDNFDGSAGSRRIARLFKSLSESDEADSQTPVFDINGDNIALFHKISLSIHDRKKLEVSYLEPDGSLKRLLLHPYELYGKADNDYLIAFCEDYDDTAVFRFDRLIGCSETRQRFEVKEGFRADSYRDTLRKKPFKARIRMSGPDYKVDFIGDRRTRLEEDIYEFEFYDIGQLIRELMLSDSWSRIISPGWLKDRLRNRCAEIMKKVEDSGPV